MQGKDFQGLHVASHCQCWRKVQYLSVQRNQKWLSDYIPIEPPIAMSWICLFESLRCKASTFSVTSPTETSLVLSEVMVAWAPLLSSSISYFGSILLRLRKPEEEGPDRDMVAGKVWFRDVNRRMYGQRILLHKYNARRHVNAWYHQNYCPCKPQSQSRCDVMSSV